MDDVKPPVRRTPPTMDIRPRPIPQPMRRPDAVVPATVPANPSPVTPAPVPVAPAPTLAPAPLPPAAPMPVPQPAVPQPTPATPISAQPEMKLPPKTKAPVAAIIIAVIVAISLIGLTIFAFMKTKSGTKSSGDTTTNPEVQSGTATPEDVDSSQAAINGELDTINDDQDFNATDLNDESLGL